MLKWMKGSLYASLLIAVLAGFLAACIRPASQAPTDAPSTAASTQPGQLLPLKASAETLAAPYATAVQGIEQETVASLQAGPTATVEPTSTEVPGPARAGRLVFRLPREVFAARFNLEGNYQVFSANLDGSDLAPLTPGLGGDLTPLDVSEDRRVLVASGKNLYQAVLDGSEPLKLADNYAGGMHDSGGAPTKNIAWEQGGSGAYWLAGGSGMVYIGLDGGEQTIYLVKPDGSGPQRLTEIGSRPGVLLPSNNLEGVTWRQGVLQNGTPIPLCDPACYHWTPLDGGHQEIFPREVQVAALDPFTGLLAFHAENRDGWEKTPITVIRPDGEPVAQSEPLNVCSLAWSPDGKQLLMGMLYGEGFCGWYRLWAPGEGLPEELSESLPSSYAQRWSPEGSRLLFEDWSGAWIASLQEQIPHPVLEEIQMPPGSATHILWVP